MIRLGTSAREREIPFRYESEFAIENKYDFIQIWYKDGNINSLYEKDIVESIKNANIKVIFHALMDVGDFKLYGDDLIDKLKYLGHKELIIHPVLKSKPVNKRNSQLLADNLIAFCNELNELGITVYVENNHDHMQVFYTLEQWKYFFSKAPSNVELLIDIVHILFCNDYDLLREMIKIKYPKALHVADTIKGMIGPKHLHLPIGDGIVDFNLIFNDILKDFDGIIVIEINNTDKKMIESKNRLLEILKDRYKK